MCPFFFVNMECALIFFFCLFVIIMHLPIFTVDAFTDCSFSGNPAAVCILEEGISEEMMQKIAMEMNLSETSFVYPINKKENLYSLRWFTPTNEVPLCGHATMATSYVLFKKTEINPGVTLRFETLSGELRVSPVPKSKEGDETLYIEMNFPLGNPSNISIGDIIHCQLLDALQLSSDTVILDIQFCSRTKKLLVVFDSVEDILKIKPIASKLIDISFPVEVRGVACTTEHVGDTFQQYDIVSRYFSPWNGIPEDPVTGSAHTVLGAYWMDRLAKKLQKSIHAFQASPGRGGDMILKVDNENDRIFLRGTAKIVLEGKLILS